MYPRNNFLGILLRLDAATLGQGQGGALKFLASMVENYSGIHAAAMEGDFEMKMFCRCPARTTGKTNDLSCLHLIAALDKVFGLMAVQGLETISMLDTYTIAITIERPRSHYSTIESC